MLSKLNVGESAILVNMDLPDAVQNHLMHMGFVPNARVTVLRRAPAGDPTVYAVDGMEVALRRETAREIEIRPNEEPIAKVQIAGRGEAKASLAARSGELAEAAR
jgi:Fe2+ transport system protein FeoA